MGKGPTINNKKAAEVITSYAVTNNYCETARECGVSNNSVKRIIKRKEKENPEELARIVKQKKDEFYDKANTIVFKGLNLIDKRMDTALNNQQELEQLIDLVLNDTDDEESENKLTRKEKVDIARKLSRIELNSLSEITTSVGTLYDKMRLERGETTENSEITIKMSNEVKELAR